MRDLWRDGELPCCIPPRRLPLRVSEGQQELWACWLDPAGGKQGDWQGLTERPCGAASACCFRALPFAFSSRGSCCRCLEEAVVCGATLVGFWVTALPYPSSLLSDSVAGGSCVAVSVVVDREVVVALLPSWSAAGPFGSSGRGPVGTR